MYTGKFAAPRRAKRRKGSCRALYVLHALLLILAALRIFGSDGEKRSGDASLFVQARAAIQQDADAPVITGVRDLTVYVGDGVAFRQGITVTDNLDAHPELTVDSSAVDLLTPGSYPVSYRAEDAAGNTVTCSATVTVMEKEADFADADTVYALLDDALGTIVTEDMTPMQQAEAIYAWAKASCRYGGHSTRSKLQAAYEMLTQGTGDCYGYFAVTSLMLQRLGIPTIDVTKVKAEPEDSEHFWSLVSLDGGGHYYHFDATPRLGTPTEFCLVTDAFLDAYSASHGGSHNRDTHLYPATPEEAP